MVHKGFSLIEVLLSLTLTSTLMFFVFELYRTSFFFFNRTLLQTSMSVFLDDIEELLILEKKPVLTIDSAYQLEITKNNKLLKLELRDKKQNLSLSRYYEQATRF